MKHSLIQKNLLKIQPVVIVAMLIVGSIGGVIIIGEYFFGLQPMFHDAEEMVTQAESSFEVVLKSAEQYRQVGENTKQLLGKTRDNFKAIQSIGIIQENGSYINMLTMEAVVSSTPLSVRQEGIADIEPRLRTITSEITNISALEGDFQQWQRTITTLVEVANTYIGTGINSPSDFESIVYKLFSHYEKDRAIILTAVENYSQVSLPQKSEENPDWVLLEKLSQYENINVKNSAQKLKEFHRKLHEEIVPLANRRNLSDELQLLHEKVLEIYDNLFALIPSFNKKYKNLTDLVKQSQTQFAVLNEAINKQRISFTDEFSKDLAQGQNQLDSKIVECNKQIGNASETAKANMASRIQSMREDKTKVATGLLIAIIIGTTTAVVIAWVVSRWIATPLKGVVTSLEGLAKGDLRVNVKPSGTAEVRSVGEAINSMATNLNLTITDLSKKTTVINESSGTLLGVADELHDGAGQTSNQADTLASATEEMSTSMHSISAATDEASGNVTAVVQEIEKMTGTIANITSNTEQTSQLTAEAVRQASDASTKVKELGSAAQDISKVTESITEISEQTNLLALNATIEAARAGEAGKGFAVVANEIKELARQTASATLEIKEKIEGIQTLTNSTVTEIFQISRVITEVSDKTSTIAEDLEEQSNSTQDISNSVTEASLGLQEVAENVNQSTVVSNEIASDISKVNQASRVVSDNSEEVKGKAEVLSGLADDLNGLVAKFKL